MKNPRRSLFSLVSGGFAIAASLSLATYLSLPSGQAHASEPGEAKPPLPAAAPAAAPAEPPRAEPPPTEPTAAPAVGRLTPEPRPKSAEKPRKKQAKKKRVDFGLEGY